MNPKTQVLTWKECREHAWFALAGVLVFIGIPAALAASSYYCGGEFWPNAGADVVVGLGGVFAIFLAVAATCRDLSGQTYIFWRSRPIGLVRLLTVKYLVGLLILLLTTWGGLIFVMWTQVAAFHGTWWYNTGTFDLGLCHSPVLVLIFSIAFLLGCLVRQAARAATLALLAGLLIYFLPLLLPALADLSFFLLMARQPWQDSGYNATPRVIELLHWFGITDTSIWRQMLATLPLTLAGVFGSVVAFAAACSAAARSWRLRADKKALSWSLVAVVLGLMAVASVQVGSNMKCTSSYDLAPAGTKGHVQAGAVFTDGQKGVLSLYDYSIASNAYNAGICTFNLEGSALHFGPFVSLDKPPWSITWSAQDPQRLYYLTAEKMRMRPWPLKSMELVTVSVPPDSVATVVQRLDLSPEVSGNRSDGLRLARAGQRLYIRTRTHLLTVDISNADAPRLVSKLDLTRQYSLYDWRLDWGYARLLPIEGVSARERLEVTVALSMGEVMALDGDLLVQGSDQRIDAYRLSIGQDEKVGVKRLGRYTPPPLEQLIGFRPGRIVVRDGIAYLLDHNSGAMEVMDVRNPAVIRRIGHYRSGRQNFADMALLADGSILLAGSKVEIIAPPRLKD